MDNKHYLYLVLVVLVMFIPPKVSAPQSSSQSLSSTTTVAKIPYCPSNKGLVVDIGCVYYNFLGTGQWYIYNTENKNFSGSGLALILTLSGVNSTIPLVSSVVQYNSTYAVYNWSGTGYVIQEQFVLKGYIANITVSGTISATYSNAWIVQPFVSLGVTNTTNSVSISGETYSWNPVEYSPSYSSSTQLLYWKVPLNTPFTIDPIAIDNSAESSCNSGTTCPVTLTTTNANDIILLFVSMTCGTTTSCSTAPTLSSVSGDSLTWNTHNSIANGVVGVAEDYTTTTTTVSGAITGTFSATCACTITAIGISGYNTGTPFDPNSGAKPTNSGSSTTCSVSISTSNANDMIVGLCGEAGTIAQSGLVPVTAGSGFTLAVDAATSNGKSAGHQEYNSMGASENKVVSATQSSLSVPITLVTTGAWAMMGDAIEASTSNNFSQSLTATVNPLASLLTRVVTSTRSLTGTVNPLSGVLTRAITAARSETETISSLTSSMTRVVTFARSLVGTISSLTTPLSRLTTESRSLTGTINPLTTTLTRTITESKSLTVTISSYTTSVSTAATYGRSVVGTVNPVSTTLTRVVTFNISLTAVLNPISTTLISQIIHVYSQALTATISSMAATLSQSENYLRSLIGTISSISSSLTQLYTNGSTPSPGGGGGLPPVSSTIPPLGGFKIPLTWILVPAAFIIAALLAFDDSKRRGKSETLEEHKERLNSHVNSIRREVRKSRRGVSDKDWERVEEKRKEIEKRRNRKK